MSMESFVLSKCVVPRACKPDGLVDDGLGTDAGLRRRTFTSGLSLGNAVN